MTIRPMNFRFVIVPAGTIAAATLNRGGVSKCGLFSALKGWTDSRVCRFPYQRFLVPARMALAVAASIADYYRQLGLKPPAIRLSPMFTMEIPWTRPRDLGRKPLREVKGLVRPPHGTSVH